MSFYSTLVLISIVANLTAIVILVRRFLAIGPAAAQSWRHGASAAGRWASDTVFTFGTAAVLAHLITPTVATAVGPFVGLYISYAIRAPKAKT